MLRELEIQGFKSYAKKTILKPSTQPGLSFVHGTNLVDAKLGGNGVGKSSLFDALCWALYGKTARGTRGKSVVSWSAKKAQVRVVWGKHTVERVSAGRNSLRLDGKDVEQDAVDECVGMGYDTFLCVVLLGQFGKYFLDLGPTDKLDAFSRYLQLDVWQDASNRARDTASAEQQEAREQDKVYERARGSVDTYKETWKHDKDKATAWEVIRKRVSAAAQQELDKATTLAKRLTKRHTGQVKELEQETKAHAKVQQQVRDKKDQLRDADNLYHKRRRVYATAKSKLKTHEEQLRDAKGLVGTQCPTCQQQVTQRGIAGVVTKHEKLIAEAQASVDKAEAAGKSSGRILNRLRTDLEKVEAKAKAAQQGLNEIRDKLADAKSESARAQERHRTAQANLDRTSNEENPWLESAKGAKRNVENAKKVLATAKKHRNTANANHLRASQWASWFKDIRLWLVQEALVELEVTTNTALASLGLPDWTIRFNVERATKAGGVSKGFTVLIETPEAPEGVPWEAWSGGEHQRLRLAGAAGFAELVRARLGVGDGVLEVWDEPTAHLSEEGVDDLLGYLQQRAAARPVWLVDHRTISGAQFDSVYHVRKHAKDGSTLTGD